MILELLLDTMRPALRTEPYNRFVLRDETYLRLLEFLRARVRALAEDTGR